MLKIEINGKTYNLATDWDEITMQQYCNIFYNLPKTESDDETEKAANTLRNEAIIISRLLGEKDDFVQNLPLSVFAMLQHSCRYIYEIDNFLSAGQFYVKIDGRKYFMPSPNEMSLRQYIDSDMIMKEEGKNQFIELLACLLLPYGKDGKYEYDGKYQDLIPKIANMKASEGLPFIYTFFKKKEISKKLSEDSSKAMEAANRLLQPTQGS